MDFLSLLKVLTNAEVEFIVIGGVAAILHGSARLTQDIDVVYRRSNENLDRIVSALSPYHPYLRGAPPGLPFRWDARILKAGLNFTLTTDLGPIDLLGHVAGGPAFENLLPDTVVMDMNEFSCRCLELQRLILTKKAAGRPKDLEPIAELEALLEERESGT